LKIRVMVSLVLLSLLPLTSVAQTGDSAKFDRLVPDDASLVLLVDDVPEFLGEWPESPLGLVWNDPKVKEFFAPLRDELEFDRLNELARENTGFSITEILEGLTGGMAVVIGNLDFSGEADDPVTIAILAEIGDNREMFTNLMARELENVRSELESGAQLREIEEEFRGQTLHVRQKLTGEAIEELDVWAVVDGNFLFVEPKSMIQELVASLADGGSRAPLADSDAYKRARRRSPDADVFGWVNIERFVTPLKASLASAEAAEGAEGADGGALGLLGISASSVIEALKLDSLEALYVAARMSPKSTFVDLGVLYSSGGGLMDVVAFGPGPVERVSFIPADAVSASVSNISIPDAWVGIKNVLGRVNPGLPAMIQLYLGQLSGEAGIDIEKSLMGSLGDRLITASFMPQSDQPTGEPILAIPQSLMGIAVTDRQSLEMVFETLKSFLGGGSEMFERREYRNESIFVSKSDLPEMMSGEGVSSQLAYALTDDWVFISFGGAEPIEIILAAQADRQRSLWERRDVKSALKSVPEGAGGIIYSDLATMTVSIFKSIAALEGLTEDEHDTDDAGLVNPESLPDAALLKRYLGIGIGSIEKTDRGLYGSLKIFPPTR
jgi:hypothetical protein